VKKGARHQNAELPAGRRLSDIVLVLRQQMHCVIAEEEPSLQACLQGGTGACGLSDSVFPDLSCRYQEQSQRLLLRRSTAPMQTLRVRRSLHLLLWPTPGAPAQRLRGAATVSTSTSTSSSLLLRRGELYQVSSCVSSSLLRPQPECPVGLSFLQTMQEASQVCGIFRSL